MCAAAWLSVVTDGTKTTSGTTYNYYYHNDTVLNETKNSANYATNIIGVTGIEARNQSGTTGFFGKDLHGDVRYAFNSSCTKIADYTYDAWGNAATSSTSTWAKDNPVRYNGQYLDSETGMYYLRARYYDPNMSRFISEDPHWNISNMIYGDEPYTYTIEDINVYNQHTEKNTNQMKAPDKLSILQANNVYSYSLNNPVNYYDYSGLIVRMLGGSFIAQCGFRVGVGSAVVWDEYGNVGLVDTISGGGGMIGVDLSGVYAEIYTDRIDNLQGASFEVGGSINLFGWSMGHDMTVSLGENKYQGTMINFGLAGEIPFEGHIQISYSDVTSSSLGMFIRNIGGIIVGNLINNIFKIE